jgi:tRNA pseudouridine55 synthase
MNDHLGWLNIYKPTNITSFGALKKIKKKFFFNKIGHAGTLDPLAEGILPVAIGKTTKLIQFISNQIKEYEFEIKWGEQTSTDDREGVVIDRSFNIPNYKDINIKLKELTGTILQAPPKASAVKINGVRAYKLLRSNKEFEIKKKYVRIYESNIIDSAKNSFTKIKIRCSKGFYVRSYFSDLAVHLATNGHVFSLKRTKDGKFCLENSILLDDLLKIGQTRLGFREIHTSVSMLDDILAYEIDDERQIKEISQGKSVKIDINLFLKDSLNLGGRSIVFLTNKKNILSFGELNGSLFKPQKVLI